MDNDKFVSVIIPTFRRPEMLKAAIHSVINQDYRNIEIIVVDDNSGDCTEQVVSEFENVKYYVNSRNCGPGYSRKIGYLASKGQFIVFLDDDDYYIDEGFFSSAISLILKKGYVFVSGNVKTLDVKNGSIDGRKMNISGEIDAVEYLKGFTSKYNKPTSTFSTVFRRDVLDEAGIENMTMMNDVAIYLRSLYKGKIYVMDDFIGVYRVHNANISKTVSAEFIIENLVEKKPIYEKIKNEELFPEYEKWWVDQICNAVSYYVYSVLPTYADYYKVRNWCLRNSENKNRVRNELKVYDAFIRNHWICEFKGRLKRILGLQ